MQSSGPPLQQMTNSISTLEFTQSTKADNQDFVAPIVQYFTLYNMDNTRCQGAGIVCHLALQEAFQKIAFCSIYSPHIPDHTELKEDNKNLFNH